MLFQQLLFSFHLILGIASFLSQNPNDVHFYFYSSPTQLTYYKEVVIHDVASLKAAGLVTKKEIVFLVHGFNGNSTQDFNVCRVLGKAYLRKKSFPNLICVDYGKLTQDTTFNLGPPMSPIQLINFAYYPQVVRNVKIIGRRMSEFILFLIQSGYGPTADNIHLIGHSLGAHVTGTCGFYSKKNAGMLIGRITGLDPAGPLVVSTPIISKQFVLSPTNAKIVEVLHTNSEFFGTSKSLGTVDWWVNGGRGIDQPECAECTKYSMGSVALTCGHILVVKDFIRSLNENFSGCKCKKEFDLIHLSTTCKPMNPNGCSKKRLSTFGDPTVRGNYYLIIKPNKTIEPGTNPFTACAT